MTSATPSRFDVFLCHNSKDKPEVKEIARELQARGLRPWLDEWELRPGLSWQELLEEQIEGIQSAAVFVGGSGIGPWQNREMIAFLSEFVDRNCIVIPVLLPNAPHQPKLPVFLKAMTWVDFRRADPDPMDRLVWGITGEKPIISTKSPKLSPKELLDRGLAKYDSKDYQGAITDLDLVIQLQPDNAFAYAFRGMVRSNAGDKQGEIVDHDRAIQIDPNYAAVYHDRGRAKDDLGDKLGAIDDYTEAIRLNYKEQHLPYNDRGIVRFFAGDEYGAISDFDRAIQIKPDYALAYYNRGKARFSMGYQQEAILDYDRAIQLQPGDAQVYNSRAVAKERLGDNQGALDDFERVIQLQPDNANAYFGRGNAKKNLGDKRGAIIDYEQAAKLYLQQRNLEWYGHARNSIIRIGDII